MLQDSGPQVITSGSSIKSAIDSVSVVFNQNMNSTTGGANSVTNLANWSLTRNGVNATQLISKITFSLNTSTHQYTAVITFTQPLPKGTFQLVAKKLLEGADGEALSSNFTLKFIVTKAATKS